MQFLESLETWKIEAMERANSVVAAKVTVIYEKVNNFAVFSIGSYICIPVKRKFTAHLPSSSRYQNAFVVFALIDDNKSAACC